MGRVGTPRRRSVHRGTSCHPENEEKNIIVVVGGEERLLATHLGYEDLVHEPRMTIVSTLYVV